ncbi:MAG TPA: TetR family transcriptional regulator C-terminal domain-containing protein [Streptosporangiaceae bacterium]|nr:TetR family transcriptional regulator C-terminal domain-containing protein [Streptosporangiaceae bacterium]
MPDSAEHPKDFTPKGQATRDRVVAAAADLMYEQGVAATSLQTVQQASRVSGSQMYHYFPDKASLVRAVAVRQGETTLGQQEPWLARLDSIAGLRAWRDYLVTAMKRRECHGGCRIGTMAGELADTNPAARAELAGAFGAWTRAIRGGLQAMAGRGQLAPGADPARLADALLAAAEGGLLLAKCTRDVTVLENALDVVIDRVESLTA